MTQPTHAADPTFFRGINWVGEDDFIVNGVRFHCCLTDYTTKSTDDQIQILKSKDFLEHYDRLLAGRKIERMLEFGMWEGGSPLLLAHATDVAQITAIDIRTESDVVTRHISKHNLQNRLHIHYGVSQGDRKAVTKAIDQDHDDQLLDLVIDDASHRYELTKAAFETAFPRLRPGGIYIIEDWNWAHYGMEVFDTGEWGAAPALSNLILELCIGAGSRHIPAIFDRVDVSSYFVVITRGSAPLGADFSVDSAMRLGRRNFKKL